jgi:hypothetical protein
MPFFIKIARSDKNLCGTTSKGYYISKSGKNVTVKWGSIYSVKRKYYWAGSKLPCVKVRDDLRTQTAADQLYNDRVRRRVKEGYFKLRSDKRIHPKQKLK